MHDINNVNNVKQKAGIVSLHISYERNPDTKCLFSQWNLRIPELTFYFLRKSLDRLKEGEDIAFFHVFSSFFIRCCLREGKENGLHKRLRKRKYKIKTDAAVVDAAAVEKKSCYSSNNTSQ